MSLTPWSFTPKFRWLVPVLLCLSLVIAGCNSDNGTDSTSTDPDDETGQTDPQTDDDDPAPVDDPEPEEVSIELNLTNIVSGLELSWSTTGSGFTTLNLCLATEAINDQFAQCNALSGGDYRPDVSSPLIVEDLVPSRRYWLQVEGERSGEAPVYSRVRVGVPLVPENADIGSAIEVVEEAFFGIRKPRDLNRAGSYTLITDTSPDAGFWSSLGSEASTQYIAVEGPGDIDYEQLNLSLQAGLTKTLNQNDQLYFTAKRIGGGLPPTDIWITDGTVEGTRRLVNGEVLNIAIPRHFVEVDGTVGFVAFTQGAINADRFYVIDEAVAGGARQLADITPYNGGVGRKVVGFKGDFYVSQSLASSRRLLKIDASTLEDELFWTMPNFSTDQRAPSNLTITSDYLYFAATETDGAALWRTDGLLDPVRLFNPDPDPVFAGDIQGVNSPFRVGERMFFFTRVWDTERTPSGWQPNWQLAVASENGAVRRVWNAGLEESLNASSFDAGNMDWHAVGNRLLFKSAVLAPEGMRWWLTDGDVANTAPLSFEGQEIEAPPSGPPHFFSTDSERGAWVTDDDRERLYFVGSDPAQSEAVGGTFNIIDNLVEVGGQLWFTGAAERNGPVSVWRIPQLEPE